MSILRRRAVVYVLVVVSLACVIMFSLEVTFSSLPRAIAMGAVTILPVLCLLQLWGLAVSWSQGVRDHALADGTDHREAAARFPSGPEATRL